MSEDTAASTDPVDGAPELEQDDGGGDKKAERSQIKFPYTDIEDAVTIAMTVKSLSGAGALALDQLAVALGGASIKSGAFRTKVATASTFGAVRSKGGTVQLTDLGHRLADDHTRGAAMVEAFLQVPLYRKLYDIYQGKSLPADAGLEAEIRGLGVVEGQADRARQAFQRSATKAGFFWGGRDRLVKPVHGGMNETADLPGEGGSPQPPPPPPPPKADILSNALLSALLKKMLPAEDQPFSAADRKRFFRALAVNLDVIYGEPTDGALDSNELANLFKVEKQEHTRVVAQ